MAPDKSNLGEPDGVRADEFAGTVITLDDADVVLIRLEADGLTIELPLPSAVAIDLVLPVALVVQRRRGALVTCVIFPRAGEPQPRRARSLEHPVL